tara:strand:- start:739 stop:951 length:213 start_codon:yes stop_codon:yes gene_type:complete
MGNIEQAIHDYKARERKAEPVIVKRYNQVQCNNDGVEMIKHRGYYECPACLQVISKKDTKDNGFSKFKGC